MIIHNIVGASRRAFFPQVTCGGARGLALRKRVGARLMLFIYARRARPHTLCPKTMPRCTNNIMLNLLQVTVTMPNPSPHLVAPYSTLPRTAAPYGPRRTPPRLTPPDPLRPSKPAQPTQPLTHACRSLPPCPTLPAP